MLPHGIWVGLCTISLYTSLLNFEIPTILWSNQLLQQEHYRAFNIEENFHISAQICQIFSVYCHWPCDLWHFALINAIKSLSMRSYCTFISSGNDSIEFMLLCDISVLYSSKETLDSRWLVHILVCEDKPMTWSLTEIHQGDTPNYLWILLLSYISSVTILVNYC